MPTPAGAHEVPPDVECAVSIIAIAKGDRWEGSCPCGWYMRGTKYECERGANGHRVKPTKKDSR